MTSNNNNIIREVNGRYKIKKILTQKELIECAKYVLTKNYVTKKQFHSVTITKDYLICELGSYENEKFCAIFLDSDNRILSFEVLFTGTVNRAVIYPRVLIKKSLELNAAAVIIAHNHPGGSLKHSAEDCSLTKQLKELLEYVDVQLLDHVIVGGNKALSFAEVGLMQKCCY